MSVWGKAVAVAAHGHGEWAKITTPSAAAARLWACAVCRQRCTCCSRRGARAGALPPWHAMRRHAGVQDDADESPSRSMCNRVLAAAHCAPATRSRAEQHPGVVDSHWDGRWHWHWHTGSHGRWRRWTHWDTRLAGPWALLAAEQQQESGSLLSLLGAASRR